MSIERRWREQYTKFGSYENEIGRSNVRGAYYTVAYGRCTVAAATEFFLVRDQDGTTLTVPQGVQLTLVSTSDQDKPGGTGMHTVVIHYLDENLDLAYELVTLNGLTPVTTIATDVRWVQSIHGATFGTGRRAVGQIDVIHDTSVVALRILANARSSRSSLIRVPRNKRLMIAQFLAGAASGTSAARVVVELIISQVEGLDQSETGMLYAETGIALQDTSISTELTVPIPINPGQIAGFVASTDKGATIVAGLKGWIEDA